jgi:carbon starvation protein CstA
MRIGFLVWALLFIVVGSVFSGTIHKYLTFLPTY